MLCPCFISGKRICDCTAVIVMAMYAELYRYCLISRLYRLFYILGECAAVCIAKAYYRRSGFFSGSKHLKRIFRIGLVAVEKMLGVKYHLSVILYQKAYTVGYHSQVFFGRNAEDTFDMKLPRLAKYRYILRLRFEQSRKIFVFAGFQPFSYGRAECDRLCVVMSLVYTAEKLQILRV